MAELIKSRGGYSLTEISMVINKVKYIITEMFHGMTIDYDIERVTPIAAINILDRYDFFAKYQIRGGEQIDVTYQVGDSKLAYNHQMIVSVIKETSSDNSGARYYQLDLVDIDYPKMIAYYSLGSNGTITDQLKSFVSNHIKSKLPIELDETKWNMNFVFNSWSGNNIVDFLCSRAISKKSDGVGYRFYKTPFKYVLSNIVDTLKEKEVMTFIAKTDTDQFSLSHIMYDEFKIESNGDFIEMNNLGYSSKLSMFDPFSKKYIPGQVKTNDTGRQTVNENITPNTTRLFRYSYGNAVPGFDNTHLDDIIQGRYIIDKTFNDLVISIKVPGNNANVIGKCVTLKTLSVKVNKDGKKEDEPFLDGRYVISKCIHMLGDTFFQRLYLKRLHK
jgi:hypothetical protein